jgi:hypothetical protein
MLAVSVFSVGLAAQAQATRTWVSGVGDDANPCSRTAPCKTWAGAISKTATGGEIDNLDAGGYGALTITKSITIDGGGGGIASALVSGTNGFTISAPTGSVVVLRNLQFQGLQQSGSGGLNGINFTSGSVLHIDHCAIMGFSQNGINITPTSGAQVFIDDTISEDNAGNGLNVVGTASGSSGEVHVSVYNSHFPNNAVGVYAGDTSRVSMQSSDANGNAGAGFQVYASSLSATMSLVNSVAANNMGAGVQAGGGGAAATIRAANVSLFSNVSGLQTGTNGSIQSFSNNYNPGSGTPTSTIAPQ